MVDTKTIPPTPHLPHASCQQMSGEILFTYPRERRTGRAWIGAGGGGSFVLDCDRPDVIVVMLVRELVDNLRTKSERERPVQ